MKMSFFKVLSLPLIVLLLAGCGKNELSVPKLKNAPQEKQTLYNEPLYLLGKMLEVYSNQKVYIMSKDITDSTGVARATGGEIPFNITEMLRSACNRIGKQVVYVPYDPALLLNESQLGVKFQRVIPNVMITGAITEYDRTQVSEGESFNLSSFFGSGSKETDIGLSAKSVNSVSTISFDVNLVDYQRMVMIPQVQSIHSIRLYNLTEGGGLSLAFDGTGVGFSKDIKFIQGRHDAVRQLVELSVLEIIGKYKKVPYWRVIKGYEGKPNRMVTSHIKEYFNVLNDENKIKAVQELLPYYGYKEIVRDGKKDKKTLNALNEIQKKYKFNNEFFTTENYISLYYNLPFMGQEI